MRYRSGLLWSILLLEVVAVITQGTPPRPVVPTFFTVLENAKIGSTLFTLSATDPDPGENLTFSMITDFTKNLVNLGPVISIPPNNWTCNVTLKADLDVDLEPSIRQLFFSVEDRSRSNSIQIGILMFISDVNDNPPNFVGLPYRISIREDHAVSSSVFQVSATDPDKTYSATYFNITAVNGDYNQTFQLGPGGVISLSKPLDYETLSFYHYNVTVKDGGNPPCPGETCLCVGSKCDPGPVDLFITIQDVQDTPPIFYNLPYIGTVPENETQGFSILQVSAVDGDRGVAQPNLIHYSFTEGDSSPFVISESNGTISVSKTLDADLEEVRNKGGLYFFTVTATEVPPPGLPNTSNSKNTTSTQVSIRVTDVNDNPPKFTESSYEAEVQENTPKGVPITIFSNIEVIDNDQDLNNRFWVYLEKDGLPYKDFETLPKENTVIQGRSTITIRVVNSSVLDYENIKNITFKIIAKENNSDPNIQTSSEATVILHINDTNDNSPTFPNQITKFSVSEDAPIGLVIGNISANDVDIGEFGRVVFKLEEDESGAFNISQEGILFLAKSLDRETRQNYNLTVVASDNPSAEENQRRQSRLQLQIMVLDVNDNSPEWIEFIPYRNIPESSEVGMMVAELRAVDRDKDLNSQIEYSISPGMNGSELFNITTTNNSGRINIQQSLIDNVGLFIVQVVAKDKGTPPRNATEELSIFVRDENQNPPVFVQPNQTLYNSSAGLIPEIEVYEEQTIGSVLYTLIATDNDIGLNAEVTYYLDPTTNRDYEYFTVDRFNGTLKSARRLDRDSKETYEIQVKAADNGQPASLTTTVIMIVKLKDINDNEPTYRGFTMPQVLQVVEERNDAFIGLIEPAVDFDSYPNNQTCYYLYGNHPSYVYLDKSSRSLSLTEKIDREVTDELNIIIKASENCSLASNFFTFTSNTSDVPRATPIAQASPPGYNSSDETLLWLKVTVLDINDSPPQFISHDLLASAIYDVDIGTEVLSLMGSITDKDTPVNRKNKFKLQSLTPHLETGDSVDTPKEAFVVSVNGSVRTNIRFRSDILGYFLLQVLTYDDDGLNDTANIKIFLISNLNRLVLVFNRLPNQVEEKKDSFVKQLSDILKLDIVVDKIQSHTRLDGTRDPARTDTFIHGRYRDTGKIVPALELRRLLDFSAAAINLLTSLGVTEAQTITQNKVEDESLDLKKIMIIVVSALAVVVIVLFLVLIHLIRLYRRRLRAATTIAYVSPKEKEILEPPGTNRYFTSENPLFGKDIKPMDQDYDEMSHSSLDENAVDGTARLQSAGPDEEQEMYMHIADNDEVLAAKNLNQNSNLDHVLEAYINKTFEEDEADGFSDNKRNKKKMLSSVSIEEPYNLSAGLNVQEAEPDFYAEIYESGLPNSHLYESHLDYTEI